MQLLVHITNHRESINPIMRELMNAGFHGATSVDCEGMLHSINEDSDEAPAIFGGLREFVNPDREQNKMLLLVCNDESVTKATEIIRSVAGDLDLPNTGIIFTTPITRWEGIKVK